MATRGDYLRTSDQIDVAKSLYQSNAWDVFADACEDAVQFEVPLAKELAWLSRAYPRFESLRRAGMAIPRDEAMQYAEYNQMFEMPDRMDLIAPMRPKFRNGTKTDRIGPFYTKLQTGIALTSNWHWLEEDPIRHLVLTITTGVTDDLALILRNHRMGWMTSITLNFNRGRVNPADVAKVITGMSSTWLNCFELSIHGVDDRLKLVRTAFNQLRSQPQRGFLRGAKLLIAGTIPRRDWDGENRE